MLKILISIVFVSVPACAVDPEIRQSGESSAEVTGNPDPLLWMLGAWDCPDFTGYQFVPPWKAHQVQARLAYTLFASSAEAYVVHGTYEETVPFGFPVQNFEQVISIDRVTPPTRNGYLASLDMLVSDGTRISGLGNVRPTTVESVSGSFNFSSAEIVFPDGTARGWKGTSIGTRNAGDRLSANFSVADSPGVFELYLGVACHLTFPAQ